MTTEQIHDDIDFLSNRAMFAGSCSFREDRETGLSSNSIVAIAYGLHSIAQQKLPSDQSDLAACERMWLKLPKHRQTANASQALALARAAVREARDAKVHEEIGGNA